MENLEEKKEETTLTCEMVEPKASGSLTEGESHEIIIVGTAHVSEKSVQEVVSKIEEARPDIVAVELCLARYKALTGQEEEKEIKISELLSGGRLSFFLVQLFLAYIQKKIGDEMGVKPGSEMLAAIEAAKRTGARVALVDRDVGITIQRFWAAMGFWGKVKLIGSLIPAAIGWGDKEEIDIDNITQEDIVSQMIGEFRKISPGAANALVDERDAYLARNLILLSKQGRVLAVVGAGHREGITKHLQHPENIPAIEALNEKPNKKKITCHQGIRCTHKPAHPGDCCSDSDRRPIQQERSPGSCYLVLCHGRIGCAGRLPGQRPSALRVDGVHGRLVDDTHSLYSSRLVRRNGRGLEDQANRGGSETAGSSG